MEAKSIFFNFYEPEIIRREINEDLEHFFNSKIKNLMFATSAKVYAYMNQVVSVRIILAKFYKIPLEDIDDPEEEREYKELLKVDPLKLVEEDVDPDEEEQEEVPNSPVVKGNNIPNNNNNNNKNFNNNDIKEIELTSIKNNKEITSVTVDNRGKDRSQSQNQKVNQEVPGAKNVMIKI